MVVRVESVGQAAGATAAGPVDVGGVDEGPVEVELGAVVPMPIGVVEVGAGVVEPGLLLLTPVGEPADVVVGFGEGLLVPTLVPTVWPPPCPVCPLEQPIAKNAGAATPIAATSSACDRTRIRLVIGSSP